MATPFSPDYNTARSRFLAAAIDADAITTTFQHPLRGPGGSPLFTDVAWIGNPDADRALLTFSGTHGVEGYCGSAVQLATLQTAVSDRRNSRAAIVLVHAVNPYGFAWERRVNEDGVDVARNFIDFEQSFPANPNFSAGLANALTPRAWSGPERQQADELLSGFIRDWGIDGLKTIVPRGQYVHAQAPFFGGEAPTWSNRTVRKILRTLFSKVAELMVMDYHTGLGANGTGQLIPPGNVTAREAALAKSIWGNVYVRFDQPGSVSYDFCGGLPDAVPQELPRASMVRASYEFGTVADLTVVDALRRDHWLHAHGNPLSSEADAVRAQMRAAFFDDSDPWRGAVVQQGLWAQSCALAHLERDGA